MLYCLLNVYNFFINSSSSFHKRNTIFECKFYKAQTRTKVFYANIFLIGIIYFVILNVHSLILNAVEYCKMNYLFKNIM
ncbi:hypothetical protein NQ317_004664 [Molorchus minor]|uniref:Uncharacterized protein n=1 Tax=Molorchus minor TaxID=1323400 RepID=A0ABQ9IVC0_9CUCU|nr:hypothetical protein NQ317_004664 [Molorchus minor]